MEKEGGEGKLVGGEGGREGRNEGRMGIQRVL